MMWNFISEKMQRCESSFFDGGNRRYSYKDIISLVSEHGFVLRDKLPAKSKCAILCDEGLNSTIAILSCWFANLIPIPLSKNYGEKHCEDVIEHTKPDVLITDCNEDCSYDFVYNIHLKIFNGQKLCTPFKENLHDVALIMCTSGSTGRAKGVMITAQGLKMNIFAIADYFNINSDDTIMIARPLYHCAVLTGEFLISLYNGVNIVFFDQKYTPTGIISAANHFDVTVLCATPTLFNHISLFMNRHNQSSTVTKIALSGECLTKTVADQIRKAFPKACIYNVYGLTEASPRVSYLPPKCFDKYSESVGLPLKGTEIKIIDTENGVEQPINLPGCILVKSPSLMKGYYNNQELTNLVITDGWLNTGDIGFKDENEFIYILSRADDMIIKGGMNIYPKEIENALNSLNEVKETMVYGIRSESGQDIAIDVILEDDFVDMGIKPLLRLFAAVLPEFQMPTEVHLVKEFARNASGKLIRPNK